jgi:methyltransferase (TIGR00027 family)
MGRVLLASPLRRQILWMQVRTRVIDDLTVGFTRDGGRQIVILGAGFDDRAVRLLPDLAGARVFEVDHQATQARKRRVLEERQVETPGVAYVSWDFERDPLGELPSRLRAEGLDFNRPTLTLWEGVIPYLTEAAVAVTVDAVRVWSAEGSRFVLNYLERRRIEAGSLFHHLVARIGEPLRFGWAPDDLPGWLSARGFALISDRGDAELASELLAPRWAAAFHDYGSRIAVAMLK